MNTKHTNDEDDIDELLTAISHDISLYEEDICGQKYIVGDEETENTFNQVKKIEKCAMAIIHSKAMPYDIGIINGKLKRCVSTPLARMIRRCGNINPFSLEEFHVHEHVQIWDERYKAADMDLICRLSPRTFINGKYIAEHINDFVLTIRQSASDTGLRKTISHRRLGAERNYESASEYIDALFRRHGNILVLRIDFYIISKYVRELSIAEKKAFISRFKNNQRSNKLFEYVIGFIIKTECSFKRGMHWHAIFFLDANQHQNDAYWADQIGQYWEKITEGKGQYNNCNRRKYKYKNLGIGKIKHTDLKMRNNLLLAVRYLCKQEQHIGVKLSPKEKAFNRGQVSTRDPRKPGRPRKAIKTELPENTADNA